MRAAAVVKHNHVYLGSPDQTLMHRQPGRLTKRDASRQQDAAWNTTIVL